MTRQQLDFEIKREMIRAERSRQSLAFVVIELPESCRSRRDISHLSKLLQRRLRRTDKVGYIENGRAAVLLPRTTREGARKVADNIGDLYPRDRERPTFEVYEISEFSHCAMENGLVGYQASVADVEAKLELLDTVPALSENSSSVETVKEAVDEFDLNVPTLKRDIYQLTGRNT